jgi:hypothetical protein
MRTTLYGDAGAERRAAAFAAPPLAEVFGASAGKQQRSKRIAAPVGSDAIALVQPLAWVQPHHDATVYESVVLMAACN